MKHAKLLAITAISVSSILSVSCGRKAATPVEEPAAAPYPVLADNAEAKLSDVLQKLRGRWVKELKDPYRADPSMIRLFAIADNTLGGRFLFAGAFDDTGVSATLTQVGEVFTLTLTDDDLRPHDSAIPRERVFTGAYDSTTQTLELKSKSGEWMRFELPGGYALKFSGHVLYCIVIPTPDKPTSPSGATGTIPVPIPVPIPGGPSGSSGSSGIAPHSRHRIAAEPISWSWDEDSLGLTIPPPRPSVPAAKNMSCGMHTSYDEDWSRMSGSG